MCHMLCWIVSGFNFGECQTGEKVDDVILPQWAKGNARLFVLKHRQVSTGCIRYDVIISNFDTVNHILDFMYMY